MEFPNWPSASHGFNCRNRLTGISIVECRPHFEGWFSVLQSRSDALNSPGAKPLGAAKAKAPATFHFRTTSGAPQELRRSVVEIKPDFYRDFSRQYSAFVRARRHILTITHLVSAVRSSHLSHRDLDGFALSRDGFFGESVDGVCSFVRRRSDRIVRQDTQTPFATETGHDFRRSLQPGFFFFSDESWRSAARGQCRRRVPVS